MHEDGNRKNQEQREDWTAAQPAEDGIAKPVSEPEIPSVTPKVRDAPRGPRPAMQFGKQVATGQEEQVHHGNERFRHQQQKRRGQIAQENSVNLKSKDQSPINPRSEEHTSELQ